MAGASPGPSAKHALGDPRVSKVNIEDIPWTTYRSPKGKFSSSYKEISLALGAKRNAPVGAGGHPFDLCLEKLAPGEISCPFHSHAAQWEMFYIVSGTGTVRLQDETQSVQAGDTIVHPPGEVHQITGTGTEDLVYFIIADNPPHDFCHYPDSKKWSAGKNQFFREIDAEYWDGEE
jgi:uncharacterized cupin superfamily protein